MGTKGKDHRNTVLSRQVIEEARELMLDNYGAPEVDYHHPKCARLNGDIYCNCGARPLDQVFKQDLERMEKERA